ncbi:MAG: TetR/AcrR family transcriptional regulator [Streptosporangiaceae bacterium]|nr:TetR/AcrR family transcriptional regulator [Streptosporangiaceae bacterium]MBV9854984.1 TetR/AcrR family transcriptional regulator [Streptosporangiaceae bacterium]
MRTEERDVAVAKTATPRDTQTGTPQGAPGASRRPGRPRSERAERAMIDAALDTFAEAGVEGFRCEAVAARAGVGKATLYRRWTGKEDLLVDALASLKSPFPEPRGESVREDLVAMLEVMVKDAADPRYVRLFTMLRSDATQKKYPRLMARYMETVVEPRREMMRSVLRRGIATGEIRAGTDVEIALLALTGTVMARDKHHATPAGPDFAARVVDELLLGLAPR